MDANPWWARRRGDALPRFWVVVLIVVTLVVGASRIAAVPGSIWHQDEAVFASSVLSFNIEPFAVFLNLSGRPIPQMIYDVDLGRSQGIPPPWENVAIYTDHQDRFIRGGGTPQVFRCRVQMLVRIEPSVYDEVAVVPGASVRPARRRLPAR